MNIMEFIIPCIAAFTACIGFSLFYNIHGRNIVVASLCGAFSWAVYLIADYFFDSVVIPYFVAGIFVAIYSEVAAYTFHSPITVYLILGIIPLVPGLTIYRAMSSALTADLEMAGTGLVNTLKIGGSITLGLILASSSFRLFKGNIKKKNS